MSRTRVWTPEKLAELRGLIEANAHPSKAARAMGISNSAVINAAAKYGMEFRRRG